MKRDLFINEINDYQDILKTILEESYDYYSVSEYESVYFDITEYEYDKYEGWTTIDFIEFIRYLQELTGLRTKLKGVIR